MSYISGNLSLTGGVTIGGKSRKWYYESADSISTILGAGYISDATKKRMQIGDLVDVLSGTLNTALTASPSLVAVGTVSEFASVPAYCLMEVASISAGAATLSPAGKWTVILPLQDADLAAGTFKIGMPSAFIVTSALFRIGKPGAGAGASVSLQVGISGTPVTGGVIALTLANTATIGGTVAGSAITGANVGAAGSTLEVAATITTVFTGGDGYVEFTVADLGAG